MSTLRNLLFMSLALVTSAVMADQTAGERLDDTELTARVKTALIQDDTARARNIDVETQSGVVQLSGFVESEQAKRAAEAATRGIAGVADVRNELIVRPTDRTAGAVVDDTVIAAKINGELVETAGLGTASAVNVEVRDGLVQLSGFVRSEEEKQRAETVASEVEGVTEVRNDIAVRR